MTNRHVNVDLHVMLYIFTPTFDNILADRQHSLYDKMNSLSNFRGLYLGCWDCSLTVETQFYRNILWKTNCLGFISCKEMILAVALAALYNWFCENCEAFLTRLIWQTGLARRVVYSYEVTLSLHRDAAFQAFFHSLANDFG